MQALRVEATLARHHIVDARKAGVKINDIEHGIDGQAGLGPEEGRHARAHAAAGTATGHVEHVDAHAALHNIGQVGEVAVKGLDHRGQCALVGSVRGTCTHRAAQRVLHGAKHLNVQSFHTRVEVGHVHGLHRVERGSHRFKRLDVAVEELDAARICSAHATVGGGGAAQAQNDLGAAARSRVEQQLAHTVRGGASRAHALLNELDAARCGHLDDRRAIGQNRVGRVNRHADRAAHAGMHDLAGTMREHRLHRAIATVGKRDTTRLRIGQRRFDGVRHDTARLK